MAPPSDIATAAFGTRSWRSSIDALYEATGLVVGVMDSAAKSFVHTSRTCTYCDLMEPCEGSSSTTCLSEVPDLSSGQTVRTRCRGGLPCFVTPIEADSSHCCTLIVGGFVSSTRDRKRIFERLLSRGTSETQARAVTRDIPILTQREVEALTRMTAVNAAEAVKHASRTTDSDKRLYEAEVFATAAREFSAIATSGHDMSMVVLERAMQVLGADSGALLTRKPHAAVLEVIAIAGTERDYRVGLRVGVGQGVEGRVAQSRRSVLVSSDRDDDHPAQARRTRVSVPLQVDGVLVGVLTVGVDGSREIVEDDVRMFERFADMAGRFLSNAAEQSATLQTLSIKAHLTSYARELGYTSGIEEVAQVTADTLESSLDFHLGGIAILGWGRDEVCIVARENVPSDALDFVLEQAVGRDVAAEPFEMIVHVPRGGEIVASAGDPDLWSTMAVEVMMRNTLVGYLFVAGPRSGMFDSTDRELLLGMAEYAAAAIEKASLFGRLRDDYAKTIAALGAALDLGERREFGHSDRVMDYAVAIGNEMNLVHDDIETLRFAGLLHDVGKTGLSEEILLKPSRLTRIEMEKMRRHAEFGAGIVEQIHFLDALAPVIMHHHERWDGEGYPVGLKGTDIPLLARILAVADAYDAMTSSSSYRDTMTPREARNELRSCAGTQFDPRVVTAFIESLETQARVGATGLLADSSMTEDQLPS